MNIQETFTATSRHAGTLYAVSSNPSVARVSPDAARTQQPGHTVTFNVTGLSRGDAAITVSDKKRVSAQILAIVSPRGNWTSKASMPVAAGGFGVGVIDSTLYVVAGANTTEYSNALYAYDALSNTWSAKAPFPGLAYAPATGVIDNVLYVVGGLGMDRGMYAYNPATNTWTVKTPPPTTLALIGAGAGAIGALLYVVGGVGGALGPLNTLYAYDPKTDSWAAKAPIPTPRAYLSASVVNGVLYAMGGFEYQWEQDGGWGKDLDTVEAYNPVTDSWSTKAPLPTPRERFAAGVIGGRIYAAGPEAIPDMVEYDPIANMWIAQTPMPFPRASAGVGVVNDVLYAVGGVNMQNGETTDSMDAFSF